MDDLSGEVTQLLAELEERRQDAAPRLFELLYSELRRMAQRRLQNERADHTLQATALLHEAYLRLVDARQDWRNRAHFFAIASWRCEEFWLIMRVRNMQPNGPARSKRLTWMTRHCSAANLMMT